MGLIACCYKPELQGGRIIVGFFLGGGWAAAPTVFPRAVLDTEIPQGSLAGGSLCLASLGPAVGEHVAWFKEPCFLTQGFQSQGTPGKVRSLHLSTGMDVKRGCA